MRTVVVVPARMGSSRFPGKPIAPLLGRPMIEHVYLRSAMASGVDGVYIATCDDEIAAAAEGFGARAIMTSDKHERASDRVAEAAEHLDADIIVMVQGDEPMINPEMISQAVAPLTADPSVVCSNLAAPIETREEFEDRNTIKAVIDGNGDFLYFSREPVPSAHVKGWDAVPRFKQVCVIPFTRQGLATFASLAQTPLEQAESIDMLRFLENGIKIRAVETHYATHSVDTPADLAAVEALMREDSLVALYAAQAG